LTWEVVIALNRLPESLDVETIEYLRNSHAGRAEANYELQKFSEVVKDLDWAIQLSTPDEQTSYLATRALSLAYTGQVAEAVADVAQLTKRSTWNPIDWYNFACVNSLASDKLPDKKQDHADRAMELLEHAVKAGFSEAAHMATDPDLGPLRDREDFKKLLSQLQMGIKKAPETTPRQ
jgi:tetratricopeptide (TPR) repeat protein